MGKAVLAAYDVTGSLYSNNAVGGAGLVMFPTWLIGEELKSGKLVPIMQNHRVFTRAEIQTINALYLDTDNLALKVRVVIDFLSKNTARHAIAALLKRIK